MTETPPGDGLGLPPVTPPDPTPSQARSAPVVIPTSPGEYYTRNGKPVKRTPKHGRRDNPSKGRPVDLTPAEEEQIARMAAVGASQASIATRLHRSLTLVKYVLARPDVQTFMQQIREATRLVTLAGVQQTQAKAMGWLEEIVDAKDAKGFDNVSRGVLALEKTAASASGEGRAGVQIAVINQQTESEEVQALIRALAQ